MKQKKLLARLLETLLNDGFVGVEIGVDKADTTICLLEQCPKLGHLYAIDPYLNRDVRCQKSIEQLNEYDKCTFLRITSDEALNQIPDNLDFIFIDGNHSYLAVQSDLKNYVQKIKSGGLLTGHDWTCTQNFGVVQAAGEYLNEYSNCFKPLFTNKELINMDFGSFKRGGWSEKTRKHLIHKKYPSKYPLWWVIKK